MCSGCDLVLKEEKRLFSCKHSSNQRIAKNKARKRKALFFFLKWRFSESSWKHQHNDKCWGKGEAYSEDGSCWHWSIFCDIRLSSSVKGMGTVMGQRRGSCAASSIQYHHLKPQSSPNMSFCHLVPSSTEVSLGIPVWGRLALPGLVVLMQVTLLQASYMHFCLL